MRERILWLGFGALLLVAVFTVPTLDAAPAPSPAVDAQAPPASAADAEVLGPEVCSACHEDRVEAFHGNPHAVLDQPGWSESTAVGGASCVSCHRGAAEHVEEGGGEGTIFAFGEDETPLARTSVCMQCHTDTHPQFRSTLHAAAGLSCNSCHSIHATEVADLDAPSPLLQPSTTASLWRGGPFDDLDDASATCAQCHAGQLAEFAQNEHHRLEEGILSCTSCHDPHAPQARIALGGFDLHGCGDCHTDKAGPFIFEHPASKVEGCTACHTPHGSTNRHLLAFQNIGELCYSCHSSPPGFHVAGAPDNIRFGPDANCVNCHSAIHGSNFHPAFLK